MKGRPWSDDELIVACYIYNTDWTYTKKIEQSLLYLRRNESSIKFRFGNFDNYREGTGGFSNGGSGARKIWDQYSANPDEMALRAKEIIQKGKVGCESNSESEYRALEGSFDIDEGSYREHVAKYRVNQDKLRKAVLKTADHQCCITAISGDSLLVASHIKPWSACKPAEMTDVHNALCLNTFHDKLFDSYRMTVNESMEVIYDERLTKVIPDELYRPMIAECTQIKINEENVPKQEYLEYHNNRFRDITGQKV